MDLRIVIMYFKSAIYDQVDALIKNVESIQRLGDIAESRRSESGSIFKALYCCAAENIGCSNLSMQSHFMGFALVL
ncbi:unnamed protein product [Colias eurytheme]|nr:unnamed protein product [Colias eurytheme]